MAFISLLPLFAIVGFNPNIVYSAPPKILQWVIPEIFNLETPSSPLNAGHQFLIDTKNASGNNTIVPQVIMVGLKTGDKDGEYSSNHCNCMRRHFCSNENRIKQERAINLPACHDDEVMCCHVPSPSCGKVEKFPLFRPFPTYGEANYAEFPWTALIVDGKDDVIYGTGILISPNFVLTTARNIHQFAKTRNLRVRMGEWDLASDVEPFEPKEFHVIESIVHQAFDPKTFQNDIAVLRLNTSIDLASVPSIRSACIARPGEDLKFINTRCFSAGWGSKPDTRVLTGKNLMKKVDLKILDAPVCERAIRRGVENPDYHWDDLSFVCAGGDQGKGLCRGDEGAALICKDIQPGSRYTIVGMSSWGTTCGEGGFPGVFTNIATHYKWIKSIDDKI